MAGDDLTITNNAVVTLNNAAAQTLTFNAGDNILIATDTGARIVTQGGGVHTVSLQADLDNDAAEGSINQTGTANAVTTNILDIDADNGIGNTGALQTAASTITADTTDGNIDIDNALATAVSVNSLTTGTTAPASINFDHTGTGGVTFFNTVSSGTNPGVLGGDITLTSTAGLIIDAAANVDSRGGTGGTLSIGGGAEINGMINVGAGDITIQGGLLDTIITVSLTGTGPVNITALRDVIIRGAVTTTSGAITIMADSDNLANPDPLLTLNAVRGGVRIEAAGSITGPAAITISGSNLYNDDSIEADGVADTTIESVQIDADTVAGTDQINADGPIAIRSNTLAEDGAVAPTTADIIINGQITSTSTSTVPATAPIRVTANDDIRFNNTGVAATNNGSLNTAGLVIATSTSRMTGRSPSAPSAV
jgi:hypothetical protein